MSDVVLSIGLRESEDEGRLASAIDTYTQWRQYMCDPELRPSEDDAPDIMVRTRHSKTGSVEKTLIFQDRRWAAAFLRIWRHERRRVS